MKTLLTAVVLIVAMNAVSQEDQHLEGQVKDKEMNGIDKVFELVAGSVLEVEVYPNLFAITDLPEGSYLCSLNNNGTRVVKRFVVL